MKPSNVIPVLFFIGYISTCPCGTLHTWAMITYARKSAEVKADQRQFSLVERCCGSQYLYWSQLRKSMLLPMLAWVLVLGESLLLAFGNAFGSFIYVFRLWWKGAQIFGHLVILVAIEMLCFIFHLYLSSRFIDTQIPEDPILLNMMIHKNLARNICFLVGTLSSLTIVQIFLRKYFDFKRYWTALIGTIGAGCSLHFVSDSPSLFFSLLRNGLASASAILTCIGSFIWSLILLLGYINIVESTPFSILIGILQPAVFAIFGFFTSFCIYESYGQTQLTEIWSIFPFIGSSTICVAYDCKWPSMPSYLLSTSFLVQSSQF